MDGRLEISRAQLRSVFLFGVVVFLIVATDAAVGGVPRPAPNRSRSSGGAASASTPNVARTPIQHVVVIFQENHSFDNVLGGICVTDRLGCDGATTGLLHDGTRIPLSVAPDIVSQVNHQIPDQVAAMNHGRMNGFEFVRDCGRSTHYLCYSQYRADEIPNLRTLAESYVISDRTFSAGPVPSWGDHVDLIAGQLDGFQGAGPTPHANLAPGPGWGCDSRKDTPWKNPARPASGYVMVPSCVPRLDGFGPYRLSPVKPIPTILDRLSNAGLSWKLYADTAPADTGYIWSICPTFASCLHDRNNHNQPNPNWETRDPFFVDAAAGTLPSYSAIMPNYALSQHNNASMLNGDNYIQSLVSAVMNGPPAQWQSTVFFIVYDDCGCFYDHVAPPTGTGLGIRVPMVIVSPQAKASYVDHTVASFNSMLAFVEKNWKLPPLTASDATAYDYCHSFVFATLPCTGPAAATPNITGPAAPTRVILQPSPVPAASIQYMKTHPPDPNDPT